MKKFVLIVPLVLSMVLAGCKNETNDPSSTYSVEGYSDNKLESILIGTWKSEWWDQTTPKRPDYSRRRVAIICKEDKSCLSGYEYGTDEVGGPTESEYDRYTYRYNVLDGKVKIFVVDENIYSPGEGYFINNTTLEWYEDGKEEYPDRLIILYKQ